MMARASILTAIALVIASCGSDPPAQPPPAACDAERCPDGCCDGNDNCQPWTVLTCGIAGAPGEPCVVCASGQSCAAGRCTSAPPGSCGPSTCATGCCANNQCVPGTTAIQCGSGGQPCAVCKLPAQCVGQSCGSVQCGPTTCPTGCCDLEGGCQPGTTEAACGGAGAACTVCTGVQVCNKGSCETPSTSCTAATCPTGCCDKGVCVAAPTAAKCGKGGNPCTACSSSQACVDGKCVCNGSSCPDGCCQGDSCAPGSELSACGTGGAPCQACTGNTVCANGICSAACSPSTCISGCCNGQSCNFGGATDVTACGTGGAACVACASGQSCVQGTCNDPIACGPSSCKNGCCKAGNCEPGTSSDACGGGGATCVKCAAFEFCGTGQLCHVKPTSTWKVTVQKVELSSDLTIGWDVGSAPDPYVVFTTGSQTKQTSVKSDTYTPLYNELLVTAAASDLTAAIKVVYWDEDYGYDDQIAECDFKFSEYQLQKGQATIYGCPGDPQNSYVLSTVFTFTLATP